jgi:hypothetical protein
MPIFSSKGIDDVSDDIMRGYLLTFKLIKISLARKIKKIIIPSLKMDAKFCYITGPQNTQKNFL